MSNKKIYMLQKLWADLRVKVPKINGDNSSDLQYYYLEFYENPKKLNRLISSFDENGVPLNKSYIDVEDDELHYYPISIGQYGLSVFHTYLQTTQVSKKDHFLRIANWFVDNVKEDHTGAYWLTKVPKPEFNVSTPWKSAFTQSRAISILLRAFQITGNTNQLTLAENALKVFGLDISEGGVRVGAKRSYIYEEYVAEAPTRILDGSMFSMFGLYDMIRVAKGLNNLKVYEESSRLFADGVEGLKHWLPKYDMGFWVYYNRCELPDYPKNDPCTVGYLKLVCAQLRIMHKLTNEPIFGEYAEKYHKYLSIPNTLRMYKTKYKVLKQLNRV